MRLELFLATVAVLGLTALVGVQLLVRLVRSWGASKVAPLVGDEEATEGESAQLRQQGARQRALIGCLVATLVVVLVLLVGTLVLGHMIIEFFRALSQGHPG